MHSCLCCVQVGVIGLVEAEWVSTLGTIDPHFVRVVDYVRAARFFAQRLRLEFVRSLLLPPTTSHSLILEFEFKFDRT